MGLAGAGPAHDCSSRGGRGIRARKSEEGTAAATRDPWQRPDIRLSPNLKESESSWSVPTIKDNGPGFIGRVTSRSGWGPSRPASRSLTGRPGPPWNQLGGSLSERIGMFP